MGPEIAQHLLRGIDTRCLQPLAVLGRAAADSEAAVLELIARHGDTRAAQRLVELKAPAASGRLAQAVAG